MARLGDLERSVMDVLWSSEGWLTAREVAGRLDHERDLAYTTVLTVLERLERKGFVRRQRAARAHRYAASDSREAVVAEAMMEALGTADDRGSALVRFVGSVSAEEAEILRRALEPLGADPMDAVGDPGIAAAAAPDPSFPPPLRTMSGEPDGPGAVSTDSDRTVQIPPDGR
ncbi:BlaI/MecI/CopY family transcriptional regulator [Frankia tisae]|uniref:BlaI/MecI/CopY family transcriptional regulator n=1 Tax=Frankia tisae TaxID=2950104 RepID=UPI0021C07FBC|nr:BlaI/MecI/CopY family transcriptional regulator [Frankia tisae]